MERHGPMVMGVCRQWLRDPRDAEDAFQATFLVLVRKAGSLRDCTLLGNWLYGVAYRVAFAGRTDAAKRRSRETGGVDNHADPSAPTSQEDRPWLYEEVNRLPEKYRAPIVLCYLEDEPTRRRPNSFAGRSAPSRGVSLGHATCCVPGSAAVASRFGWGRYGRSRSGRLGGRSRSRSHSSIPRSRPRAHSRPPRGQPPARSRPRLPP